MIENEQDTKMTHQDLEPEFKVAFENLRLIQSFIVKEGKLAPSEDDYLNLNRAYFRLCTEFYDSILLLIGNGRFYTAIVVLRSFLEVQTKAMYVEFIEKPKGTDLKPLILDEKNFPSYFKMASELDRFGEENQNGMEGMYRQFTRQGLSQYTKFSLFTHGRGPFVEALMKSDNVQLCPEGVRDLIFTARGLYETFALFHFGLQKQFDAFKKLRNVIVNDPFYNNPSSKFAR